MITAGIDVGSTGTKAVIFNGEILGWSILPTGWNPKEAGLEAFNKALGQAGLTRDDISYIVGTGYGRISLSFIDKKITEITCHARGAAYLFPNTKTVIDIGGQDSKVITMDEDGVVTDFVMNDKCAAGTGRFLQVMAGVLDLSLEEMGLWALEGKGVQVNSMCTVFAESEIIGLIAQGIAKGDIALGIIQSIAKRIRSLTGRVSWREEITFTGGLAKSNSLCQVLSSELGKDLNIPPEPQIIGALGAAILAWERLR